MKSGTPYLIRCEQTGPVSIDDLQLTIDDLFRGNLCFFVAKILTGLQDKDRLNWCSFVLIRGF